MDIVGLEDGAISVTEAGTAGTSSARTETFDVDPAVIANLRVGELVHAGLEAATGLLTELQDLGHG